ncbi:hypothetical protein UFOVP1033_87 [uncultured Caudovirales phage]|uniref:Uncharacterized protein n=1 Tax=uncultured Caudovirales phage TaxID=2100421 RepID=A0A6J5QCV9_9CAUD|nr:hypothetical protein UFOVP1033_87 [uncultured Caudovirales phage]CAB4220849.1 hypothetical protein UFOVP1631_87 [uncultured Caudovirales phage]
MTKLIFSGVEVGSNRTLLEGQKVESMGLNFWGLRKRGLPKTKIWLISEHFLPETKVYVESGASQADKAGLSREELIDLAADYQEFLVNNADRAEGFLEFDSQILGLEWIEQQRSFFSNDPKLWVIWHKEYGQPVLREMSEDHLNVAIPNSEIEEVTNLAAATRSYSSQFGTHYHALGCAKPDNLRSIPFVTASTLSWLSPMRRGETIIWDGSRLVRYPKKMKDQARPRYKNIVDKAGLDYSEFVKDSTLEATRVAVWSYKKLEESMDKKTPNFHIIDGGKDNNLSDNSDEFMTGLMGLDLSTSDNSGVEGRKVERSGAVERAPEEMQNLPVFGFKMKTIVETDENGKDVLMDVPVVQTQQTSLRQCDTCFVASNCPAFKPQNTCAFNLPVEVKTKDQLKSLLTAIIEMQGQRVAFMRFAEEMNGGYADPNLSQEIDRLLKLVGNVNDMDSNKEFIQITASRQSSGGVLSAIFGDRAQALRELPEALREDTVTKIISESIED